MIMPPVAHDVKVISIGMFTPGNTAVVWRGPMLHRALQQFLADVFWGGLDLPDGSRMELFGSGGGQAVADSLSQSTGTSVPLLGQIPIDQQVREGGDGGAPVVISDPASAAAQALDAIADKLAQRQTSLVGRSLGLA